jgi:acetyltransferase
MTIRNLDDVFKPKSVALIGASQTCASVGNVVARNLSGAGFEGLVLAVNPKYQAVEGIPCHTDIASLPSIPDLAIICVALVGILASIRYTGWAQKQDRIYAQAERRVREERKTYVR